LASLTSLSGAWLFPQNSVDLPSVTMASASLVQIVSGFFFLRDIQTATCLSISHQKNSSASRYGIVEDDIEKSTPGVPHKASAKNKYMVAPKRPFNFVDFCHSQRIYHTEKCAFYERATCGSVTVKKFNTSIL